MGQRPRCPAERSSTRLLVTSWRRHYFRRRFPRGFDHSRRIELRSSPRSFLNSSPVGGSLNRFFLDPLLLAFRAKRGTCFFLLAATALVSAQSPAGDRPPVTLPSSKML